MTSRRRWFWDHCHRDLDMASKIQMPNTAHCLYEKLDDKAKNEFDNRALNQIHRRLYPQHQFLADYYYDRAVAYWSKSQKLMNEFKPGLVALRAYRFYRDDVRAGRLNDREEHIENGDG